MCGIDLAGFPVICRTTLAWQPCASGGRQILNSPIQVVIESAALRHTYWSLSLIQYVCVYTNSDDINQTNITAAPCACIMTQGQVRRANVCLPVAVSPQRHAQRFTRMFCACCWSNGWGSNRNHHTGHKLVLVLRALRWGYQPAVRRGHLSEQLVRRVRRHILDCLDHAHVRQDNANLEPSGFFLRPYMVPEWFVSTVQSI